MTAPRDASRHRCGLAVVLLAALAARIVFFLAAASFRMADSASYLELAASIGRLDLAADPGFRPPLYPLFLLALGGQDRAVFAAQSLLGVLASGLLYLLFARRSPRLGIAAGLVHALNPSTLLFESAVLSEALATFLVVLGAWWLVRALAARPAAGRWAAVGLVFSLLALTRPLFQLLAPLLLGWMIVAGRRRQDSPRLAGAALAFLLPYVLLVGGWCAFNQARLGSFALTTLTGYNLTQHSGKFFELAPERYRSIGTPYLQARERRGSAAGVIWQVRPELLRGQGASDAELSRTLTRMSLGLFVRHPLLYLQSVAGAAALFWLPAPYHQGFRVGAFLAGLEPGWVYVYAAAYLPAVGVVLALIGACSALKRLRPRLWNAETGALAVIVAYTWAVSSLGEWGENARYKVPVESLFLAVGLELVETWRARRRRS